jgi:hypothetical protein
MRLGAEGLARLRRRGRLDQRDSAAAGDVHRVGGADEPDELGRVGAGLGDAPGGTRADVQELLLVPGGNRVGSGFPAFIHVQSKDLGRLDARARNAAGETAAGVERHPPGRYRAERGRKCPNARIPDRVPRQRSNSGSRSVSASQRSEARRLLADASVEQLRRLGKALGNGGMVGKLAANDAVRDALLAVVHERLQAIEGAQNAELDSLERRAQWWRDLRRGARGVGLPEPTRWGQVARLYRQATVSVCSGDLGRGVDLLRQALDAERAARKAVPDQVVLPASTEPPRSQPAVMADVKDGEGCTPTQAAATLAIADRIENVSTTQDAAARLPNTGRVWWGETAEGEEETPEEGASPGSKRLQEPAAKADLQRRPDGVAPGIAPPVREVRAEVAPELAPRQPVHVEGREAEPPRARRQPKR